LDDEKAGQMVEKLASRLVVKKEKKWEFEKVFAMDRRKERYWGSLREFDLAITKVQQLGLMLELYLEVKWELKLEKMLVLGKGLDWVVS
jgi:hypothetical protein